MRRLIPLFVILLLAVSCAKEEFDVSSLSLQGRREVSVQETAKTEETLTLSASFSDPAESYSFSIASPDGLLRWEGAMTGSDMFSATLEITDDALFPDGEYSVLFYSSNGTELNTSVRYSSESGYPSFIDGSLDRDSYVLEYDADGNLNGEGERSEGYTADEDTVRVVIERTDRFGNTVSVSQSFLP